MSYCRWSSDNWRCPLYCYADAGGGWTTHVAGNKPIGVPEIPPFPYREGEEAKLAEWTAAYKAQMEFLKTAERRDIELPYAGETFNDPTLEAFRDRLLALRAVGYDVPDYVLERVEEEMAEQAALEPPQTQPK